MESTQRVTVGGALLLGVIVGILLLGLAPGVAAQADNETAPANASFGAQVSAYMQSTAADANGSVDRGMWRSAAANASNPGAVVSERARDLERRVARLENESETLAAAPSAEGAAGVVYTARASAMRAELANLRQSLDQTAATAASTGVDDERLTAARQRAGNVIGPTLPANARDVTSDDRGPPEWVPGGPEGNAGPPTGTPGADTGNRSSGGPGNGGPPDDRGNGGPPEDRGNEDASGVGGEAGPSDGGNGNPPDEAGNGDAGGNSGTGDDADRGQRGNPGSGGENGGSGGNPGNSGTGGSDNAGTGGQGDRP